MERTFLLKYKPENLDKCKSVEILDVYFPKSAPHPHLRLRKKGDKFELTKKQPLNGKDSSEQAEHTIILSEEEYKTFAQLPGKSLRKIRYYYPFGKVTAEIDVYQDDLQGLCVVDFEFEDKKEKDDFLMPDFCLCDIVQNEDLAAGILTGKKYNEIKLILDKLNYKKIL